MDDHELSPERSVEKDDKISEKPKKQTKRDKSNKSQKSKNSVSQNRNSSTIKDEKALFEEEKVEITIKEIISEKKASDKKAKQASKRANFVQDFVEIE